jgi:hypothetical protein
MWLACSVLAVFWLMQVAVMVLLHYGNTATHRWWPCYIIATALGVLCTLAIMWLFLLMDANLGLGLAAGVAYVLSQAALILVTKARPSPAQLFGAALTALGLFLLALGTPAV